MSEEKKSEVYIALKWVDAVGDIFKDVTGGTTEYLTLGEARRILSAIAEDEGEEDVILRIEEDIFFNSDGRRVLGASRRTLENEAKRFIKDIKEIFEILADAIGLDVRVKEIEKRQSDLENGLKQERILTVRRFRIF